MSTIISFNKFSFRYKSLSENTLKNINFQINEGEKVLIVGPSGSGKSTLAHCINGLIPFSYNGYIEGEVTINGIRPYEKSIFEVSREVGTILQDQDAQFIGLSVGEDVAFTFENDIMPVNEMRNKVTKAVKTVNMFSYIHKSPYELSGGQKQRVSLAGVLETDAKVLLFDEPLANLDPASGKKAMALISEIHKATGKTIVIVEHRIEDVLEQSFDKVVIMDKGEIKAIGTPDEILASNILRECGLREPLYIEALKHAECEILTEDKISHIDSINKDKFKLKLKEWYKKAENKNEYVERKVILELDNVKFSYEKKNEVIKGVSFKVHGGEIVALLGNNGAGKSTLSNLITGINKIKEGNIYFKNENINDWSIRKRGSHIGYVMQNPNHMITQHMIKDEVALGLVASGLTQEKIDIKVEETLKICGLYAYRNWPVSALSYGQKKRLTIASILALNPEILILDEPTAGQDYKNYTEFMEFIKKLAKEGIAIILITHDMHLALEYSDRAIVISEGLKIDDDKVSKIFTNKDIINRANLKETSLSKIANYIEIDEPNNFVQYFIDYEKKVKHFE